LAQTRLNVPVAQTKVNVAANKAIQRKFQEYRFLLNIGESGKDTSQLDPVTALSLARLARETLLSEYNLALSKVNACQKELVVLQNAADEALVFLTDADHQIARIFHTLTDARIAIPEDPLPFSSSNPTFERPDHLFCHSMEEEEQSSSSRGSSSSCDSDGGSPSNLATSTPLPN
jgi:hypothetical protein